ncbi:Transcriptional regulator, HxlR family [hydrothermal vent metagenome]|uniref:Transcriptional regulator, HxlR family n=1 Tax=hydrothermal vent metagenome TaxID=652676 RepID=A0A3B0Y668_9ZZZZ
MRKQRHPAYTHCPVEAALDIIGGKWKSIILFRVMEQTRRFNDQYYASWHSGLKHICYRECMRKRRPSKTR